MKKPVMLEITKQLEEKLTKIASYLERQMPAWKFNLFIHRPTDDGAGDVLYIGNVPHDVSFPIVRNFIDAKLSQNTNQPPTSESTH